MAKVLVLKHPIEPDVLSVPQAAKKLKTTPENVYALIRMGKLQCLLLGQQSIPKSELKRFMDDNLGVDLRSEIQRSIEDHREQRRQNQMA